MVDIASGWVAPPGYVVYIVIIAIYSALFALAATVARRLSATPQWSLADALSEEAQIGEAGALKTVMVGSTSRLIAFLGMIGILGLFLGFGAFVLWGVAETGRLPEQCDQFGKFLLGGCTLFAPYMVNKFSAAVGGS